MNQNLVNETLSIGTITPAARDGSTESTECGVIVNAMKVAGEDRWSHDFVLTDGETKAVLFRSIEGDAEGAWPPSPPLQEINKHDLGNSEALLGVGMAGTSHWSSSLSTEATAVVADLACLVKQASTEIELGSTYRVDEEASVTVDSPTELRISNPAGSCQLVLRSRKVAGHDCTISFEDGIIRVQPAHSDSDQVGQNRWCFVVTAEAK